MIKKIKEWLRARRVKWLKIEIAGVQARIDYGGNIMDLYPDGDYFDARFALGERLVDLAKLKAELAILEGEK